MFLVFESTKIGGLQQECKIFGRGLLGAILGSSAVRFPSLSEGKKTVMWRSSRYSPQGGPALSAELGVVLEDSIRFGSL
jgi:hypothetical protein